LRGAACAPDASKQELSRTVVGAVRIPLFIISRFDVWLSREESQTRRHVVNNPSIPDITLPASRWSE